MQAGKLNIRNCEESATFFMTAANAWLDFLVFWQAIKDNIYL